MFKNSMFDWNIDCVIKSDSKCLFIDICNN